MASEPEPLDEEIQFVLRMWLEEGSSANFWRGSIQEIGADQVRYFEDVETALQLLDNRLIARNGVALSRNRTGGQHQ
jgi:hypothetical protein